MMDLKQILGFKLIDTENIDFSVWNLIVLIVALIVTTQFLKLIRSFMTRKLPVEDKNRFVSIFQFIKYFVYLFVFVFTLHVSGVNMSVFLTASAALFVGLGFALQTFFQDIISGILIILDQSLHVGDIIEVEGRVGEVKQIKLRSTVMVTRNDRVLIIPNHKFMTDILFNWTQNKRSNREQVKVGVAYGSDVNLVRKILIECVENTDGIVIDNPITVNFENFGDSSLDFSVNFFVEDGMISPRIQSDIRFKIVEAFKNHKIEIPYPQRDIHIIS